jgi:hypothetical protein
MFAFETPDGDLPDFPFPGIILTEVFGGSADFLFLFDFGGGALDGATFFDFDKLAIFAAFIAAADLPDLADFTGAFEIGTLFLELFLALAALRKLAIFAFLAVALADLLPPFATAFRGGGARLDFADFVDFVIFGAGFFDPPLFPFDFATEEDFAAPFFEEGRALFFAIRLYKESAKHKYSDWIQFMY